MIKLLLTSDWHFASKNPVSRIDSYNEELFGLLDQILKVIVHAKPAALLVAGDIFHDKSKAPWSVVVRLLQWAQAVNVVCPILVIPGNHDVTHDRYESWMTTPIGALISSELFVDVSFRKHEIKTSRESAVVYGVPWPDGIEPIDSIPHGVDVVMVHGFVSQTGEPIYGTFCHKYEDLAAAAPHVRVWHFGHDHQDRGVYTCKNGARVVSIGALSRGALDQDTLTRQVKTALVTLDGPYQLQVQQIAMRTAPVDQIFDLQKRAEKVKEATAMTEFVAQLKTGLAGFSTDHTAALAKLPLEAAVRAKVESYITRAEQIV